MVTATATKTPSTINSAVLIAASVPDPELPMVTLADLGILRDVHVTKDGAQVTVEITPTYTGCPALREIAHDIRHRLNDAGYPDVTVKTVLAPAWTTDWITPAGRRKLAKAGIAPPNPAPGRPAGQPVPLQLTVRPAPIACPQCGSTDTERTAEFSATACKSLHRCRSCAEPFEYVKEI